MSEICHTGSVPGALCSRGGIGCPVDHPSKQEERVVNVVRFIREAEDEQRGKRGEEPITDVQLAGKLLAMKHFSAAEELLARMYAEQPSEVQQLRGELKDAQGELLLRRDENLSKMVVRLSRERDEAWRELANVRAGIWGFMQLRAERREALAEQVLRSCLPDDYQPVGA